MVTYIAPETVEEACSLLSSTPSARVFAGATDMLPQARAGRALPETLVDLKHIPRLNRIESSEDVWIIGAAVNGNTITRNAKLGEELPGLVDGVALIGSDQIQSRASIGGNLCNASPAADTGPPMVVNGAIAVVVSDAGERRVPAAELCVGPGRTSLASGEFVVEFEIERPTRRTADAYMRMTPRTEMDIAIVGVAARIGLSEGGECVSAAVVLGAVGPTTVFVEGITDLLVGEKVDDSVLDRAAALSSAAARPIDDRRGTADYRRHVAGVLTKRVIARAAERAAAR